MPVGQWVISEACRQGADWHRQGLSVAVSVNMSARQLDGPIAERRCRVRAARGGNAEPDHFIIEVTESTLMRDVASAMPGSNALKALGVRIAIDDFGTGYFSLSYLRQFPIDILKIDQSFIATLTTSSEAGAIIHTLVQLGKTLGLETVAEGIEEPGQLARVRGRGRGDGSGIPLLQAAPRTGCGALPRGKPRTPGRTSHVEARGVTTTPPTRGYIAHGPRRSRPGSTWSSMPATTRGQAWAGNSTSLWQWALVGAEPAFGDRRNRRLALPNLRIQVQSVRAGEEVSHVGTIATRGCGDRRGGQ